MVDIIIPILNEEPILTEKRDYYLRLKQSANVIFVDGGSTDRTATVARQYGQVISSDTGRSVQKNQGAQAARSGKLLFLHVDTYVDEKILSAIERTLNEGDIGGCMQMRIEDDAWIFRIYEKIVNFRAKIFGVIDGDLGTFVRKDVFDRVGGFDRLPVMEDVLFGKKLRRAGTVRVLPDLITVSSRKWREQGFMKTFGEYSWSYLKWWSDSLSHSTN